MSNNQVVVTAKIPLKLKNKLKKLNINVNALIRRELEAEVKRLEKEQLRQLSEQAGQILQEYPAEEMVEAVRASRETR
jgi:post-segregation antitoxin (ccd killing protein)